MEEITNLMEAANTAISNLEKFIFENKKEKYINLKTATDYMANQIEAAEMTTDLKIEEGYEATKAQLNGVISKCNELIEIFKSQDNIIVIINEKGEIVTQEIDYEEAQALMEKAIQESESQGDIVQEAEVAPETTEAPAVMGFETVIPKENTQSMEIQLPPALELSEENQVLTQTVQPEPVAPVNVSNETPAIEIKDDANAVVTEGTQDLTQAAFAGTPAIEIIDGPSEVLEPQQPEVPEIQNVPEAVTTEAATQVPEISIIDDMPTTMEFGTKTPEVVPAETTDYSKDLDVEAMNAFLGGTPQASTEQVNTLTL